MSTPEDYLNSLRTANKTRLLEALRAVHQTYKIPESDVMSDMAWIEDNARVPQRDVCAFIFQRIEFYFEMILWAPRRRRAAAAAAAQKK